MVKLCNTGMAKMGADMHYSLAFCLATGAVLYMM